MFPNKKLAAAIAAVCMVLSGLAAAVPTAAAAAAPLTAEIETRDQLIADQEALLNAYRCMFAVDVAAVPGGCANAAPALPAGEPGPPPPNPTKTDKDARDDLIAAQENLLNTYRCNHNIDTQLVPQGCPEATEDKEVVEKPPTTIPPPEEESDSSADVMPMPSNGHCPYGWVGVYSIYIDDYCFLFIDDGTSKICPDGFTFTHWGVCQDADRYVDCSDNTVMDAYSQCYDPSIWGECPAGMALDFRDYCQGRSLSGECPAGWILDPWNYCQDPTRDDICGGRFRLDPWGSCYDPETVDPDF